MILIIYDIKQILKRKNYIIMKLLKSEGYIKSGDIFQVVLSEQLKLKTKYGFCLIL